MHEFSIISSVIDTLSQEFSQEELERMKTIHLKVGILSNIEPRLLHNAFLAYKQGNCTLSGVELEIKSTSIKAKCDLCDLVSDIKNYKFVCSKCHQPIKKVVQGEELLIHKVEFEK